MKLLAYLTKVQDSLARLLGLEQPKQIVDDKIHANSDLGRNIHKLYRKVDPEFAKWLAPALKAGENDSIVHVLSEMPSMLKLMEQIPSNDILLNVIPEVPEIFQYIKSPSDKFISEALAINGCIIKYIENPGYKHQMEAVKSDPASIQYIKNPDESLQIEAVRSDQSVFKSIENPVPELLNKAGWIVYDPNSKHSSANLPDKIQLYGSTYPGDTSGIITLDENQKDRLLKYGQVKLDFDDSPRFDISGGHQQILLHKDGSMGFDERTTAVEGGSVNYYDNYIPINKAHCSFQSEKLKESKDIKASPKMRRY